MTAGLTHIGVSHAAVPSTAEQTVLGEGVRWDGRRDELLRLDILEGRIYRDRVELDGSLVSIRTYAVPGTVGAIAPVAGDDGWLLAAGRGFVRLRPDGSYGILDDVAPAGTRMNDAACDPQGRFWAGTMAEDQSEGGGALYRLEGSGRVERVLDALTISNGLGWSHDGITMYLVDSGPRVVYAFDFDTIAGEISNRRALIALPEEAGSPDGMTVDATGDLWVAVYGGGQVRRYSPEGALRETLAVPARQVTCCAFGGPDLDRLYVTTATEGWSEGQRREDPAAGVVYRFDVDAVGQPAALFRPDPGWWNSTVSANDTARVSRGF